MSARALARWIRSGVAVVLLCVACAASAAEVVGVITHLAGTVSVKHPDGVSKVLSAKSELLEGDILTTEKDTYVRIKFIDNAEVVMRPGTVLKITSYAFQAADPKADSATLDMLKGGLRAVSGAIGKRNKEAVSFITPTATIGIRGTHFGVQYCNGDCAGVPTANGETPVDGLYVDVADGVIAVTSNAGVVEVNKLQFGYLAGRDVLLRIVPQNQGVQVRMPLSISQDATAAICVIE
jgi:hypothetical protein